MAQEIGESREAWGRDVWQMAEQFANNLKSRDDPFYIVYCAKPDRQYPGAFRQTMKAYSSKPSPMLGILVWYVDHKQGIFSFVPELSAPPDMPVDPSLLSEKAEDASARVMEQGQRLNAIVS